MLNLSCIADQYFIDIVTDAESRMASLKAKTLLIIYPLGEVISYSTPIGEGNTYFRGETHKVVLLFVASKSGLLFVYKVFRREKIL